MIETRDAFAACMSNRGRLIRLMSIDRRDAKVMFSVNFMSVLKRWGRYAVAVLVRLKTLAPYALIELILPGGSMMALLLWLYRRRKRAAIGRLAPTKSSAASDQRVFGELDLAKLQPATAGGCMMSRTPPSDSSGIRTMRRRAS